MKLGNFLKLGRDSEVKKRVSALMLNIGYALQVAQPNPANTVNPPG
jgi:hypothetical protein